ncbi:MAG TPA: hypothetical protein VJZ73_20275 [Methylomirabilota bacterium]|nr:hypothetical protein [Methylomirabilota bacterium]
MSGLALTALLALLLVPPPLARAASFTLEPQQRSDALRVGAQSAMREGPFDAEWRVANPAGDSVTVITPFHRLVLAARNAAFKNERMKDSEPQKLLREQQDRLVIWASLRGQREDFARFYVPRILVTDREIEPSFVQNERTAMRTENGGYLARCVYGFPVKEIGPKARLVLVVRDTDGRDVSRFTIDLASMR